LFLSGNSWAARSINSATVDGSSSTTVSAGATISAVVNVSTTKKGKKGKWGSTGWRIAGSSGALTCVNHPNHQSKSGSFSENFNITAPAIGGVYNLYLRAYEDDHCSKGASSWYILPSAVTVGSFPTVDNLTTIDTTPVLTGTFNSSDSAGGFSVTVDSVTYNLAGSSELTNVGDDWTLDLGSITPLSIGVYEVIATSVDASAISATDTSSNELSIIGGAVVEFRMDEDSWSGAAGDVSDTQGNLDGTSYNGIDTDDANPAITGTPGTCRYGYFDGTNDYIEVPGIPYSNTITIMAWVNPSSYDDWSTIMVRANQNADWEDGYGLVRYQSADVIHFYVEDWRLPTVSTNAPLNQWTHIAAVYDGNTMQIFKNGVLDNERVVGSRDLSTIGKLMIGDSVWQGKGSGEDVWHGSIDEVRVYHGALSSADIFSIKNEAHSCSGSTPLVDHFVIDVGAGSANTCTPFSFTVTAEDSGNNVIPDYAETVSITTSTSRGDFSTVTATNNISPNPDNDDNGSAAYTFDELDTGAITLSLSNEHAETLTILVNDSIVPVTSTSTDIIFSDNAFTITDTDAAVAGDDVPVAGRDHSYQIQMIRKDPVTGCGVATGYDGVKPLKMWRTKNGSDPSTNSPVLDGDTLPSTDPGVDNGSITFTAGVADVTLATTDIGKFTIELADISNSFAAVTIAGTSSQQIVRPFGIGIDFENLRDADFSDNGSIDDSTGTDLSYASGIAGSVITQAGENFKVTVSGVLWSAADDADNNGVPDAAAYLGNNNVTPSFAAEGETVTLTASVVEPVGASLGSFTINGAAGGLFDAFNSGAQTDALMTYSNVGIIDISANLTDTDYFSSGVNISGSAPNVGRFNPYQYAVTASLVNDACTGGGFTYAQQEFTAEVTLEAQNKSNNRTDGYRDSYATLTVSSELNIENSETGSAYDLETFTTTESFSAVTMGSSQFDIDLRWDMGLQDKTVTMVNLIDSSDEVTLIASSPAMLGSTEVRYGRLALDNVYGSELIELTMPMKTEYFDGANFIINTDDDCTIIMDTDLSVVSSLSGGSSTVSVISTTAASGILNISLTAPGAGNSGDITVTPDLNASSDLWLRFNWDGVAGDDDPFAKATFGIYSGDSSQIYYRQVYGN